MVLILAFSLQDQVEKYGAYVGLAAFIGLAVLTLLYFAQARELKRLRDWAGRAPERAAELEARVVAQAEEALDAAEEPEPAPQPVAAPAPVTGNGKPAAPVAIPMGPRPAVAMAAAAARAAAPEPATAVAEPAEADEDVPVPVAEVAAPETTEPAKAEEPQPEPEEAEEPAPTGNGVPAKPPAEIPRATPRPQSKPVPRPQPAAAPLHASTTRSTTLPPARRSPRPGSRDGGSRTGLYTFLGIVVLAIAIFVPVYFMVIAGDDPAPPPNRTAEPGGTATSTETGAGGSAAEARADKVVVVLNGTSFDGLASQQRDKLVAAGYADDMIRIDNSDDQQRQDSLVLYAEDERRQARDVARLLDISRLEEIDPETQALADSSDESGSLPADVVAVIGADKSP